jgi:excisionase family DNA binding protein
MDSDKLLTIMEVCDRLAISYPRAAQLAREGILPVVKLGRQTRIDPKRLEEFIQTGGKALPGGWRRKGSDQPAA